MNVVVDTNVLAYYWLPGARTEEAVALRRSTDHWYVPKLWRSEFRNVLAGFLRRKVMGPDAAKALVRAAEAELADFECEIDSVAVMELVSESGSTAERTAAVEQAAREPRAEPGRVGLRPGTLTQGSCHTVFMAG